MLLFFVACRSKYVKDDTPAAGNDYAHGFSITDSSVYTKLTVFSPWESAGDIRFNYYLVPESYAGQPFKGAIRIPVRKVICLSTSHVAFVSALGEAGKICGVSGVQYISDSIVRERIEKDEIHDVGYDQSMNYELIVKLHPDVVFAYGVGSEVTGFLNRLKDLGIPVVLDAEYLEQTPLGKAEWIRFIAAFFDEENKGDSIFKAVEENYTALKAKVADCKQRPVVMTGMPYKDQWWVPGGRAYLAAMIKDAGATYLWRDNTSEESFVVSPEQMIVQGEKADFWIHTGFVNSLEGVAGFDGRFTSFPPYRNGKVYNNDLRMSPGGGNDFWESGVVHPDLILIDLISIFHPEIAGEHSLYYYRKLK